MKKVILSSLMLFVAVMMSAATYSWEKVVTVKLTDGNNDTYSSRFGAAPELTDAASWGAVTTNLTEAVTVRAYTTLGGVNYEQLYLNSIENLPLTIKTFNSETMTITLTALYGEIKLYDNGALVLTVEKGGAVETDSYVFSVAKNATIADRFVINYVAPAPDYGSYQRNVTNGNYGTICLPKNGVITGGAALFEVAYRDANTIYCDEILSGELVAGRPYIFQASADQIVVNYSDADAAIAVSDQGFNGLHGFYNLDDEDAYKAIDADVNNCVLYNNQYYYVVSGHAARINNYFAYIAFNEVSTTAPNTAPGRRRIAMAVNGEQTATDIDALNAADAPVKTVIDGKIYIIRGEHMFDATGRMVK